MKEHKTISVIGSLKPFIIGLISIALFSITACKEKQTQTNTPQSSNTTTNLTKTTPDTPSKSTTQNIPKTSDLKYIKSTPLPSPSASTSTTLFNKLNPADTGVNFTIPLDPDHPQRRLYVAGYMSGGVALGDLDNDGLIDIFFSGGPRPYKIFRQTAKFKFEDVTATSGLLPDVGWCSGAALVDIDNDNDLDIYICRYDLPNLLYINNGKGQFTEEAKKWGIDFNDASIMPSFADYDNDGDLDLYVLCNRFYREGGKPKDMPIENVNGNYIIKDEFKKYYRLDRKKGNSFEINVAARADKLYRNDGTGKFTDVTTSAGINDLSHGLSATWWDYNNDNLPDLYVANDFNDADILYRNNGDGTFTDVIKQTIPHTSWFSMGADAADLNNDGFFDFIVADMSATTHYMQKVGMGNMGSDADFMENTIPPQLMRNAVYINTGTRRFIENAFLSGLDSTNWTWAVKLADYDHDGLVDAFFTNGIVRNLSDSDHPLTPEMLVGKSEWDISAKRKPRKESNMSFQNNGELKFTDTSKQWGLDHLGLSYASAYGDIDNDGDLDLVVVNIEEPAHIYENTVNKNHRVKITLKGTKSNQAGIGAKVTLKTKLSTQIRYLQPYTGFLSTNDTALHFGTADQTQISELTILWPSGIIQRYENLKSNQHFTITEPDSSINQEKTPPVKPLFIQSDHFNDVIHRDTKYDDFKHQPLLPNRLSQLGPGIALGDIDGDGDEDIYVGGAAKKQGYLLIRQSNGTYEKQFLAAFLNNSDAEDMGAIFFDADGDSDLDLYVATGSYEFQLGDQALRDRLYLNNGNGSFTSANDKLPDNRYAASAVAAADFDRDGDLDLFVGSRVLPRQYPTAPTSSLLINNNGTFTDATQSLAPQLLTPGLVTAAIWSDIDNDGWIDLILTLEWGPVKIFKNHQGKLIEHTKESQLGKHLGWWNAITAGDIDNDGDTDYVVSNFGLNTKYHASAKKPALLYYGDFENLGRKRLVEAEFEGNTLFPLRGRSCSSRAMPFLKKQFGTFHDFAISTVEEIYTPEKLEKADRFECNTLEHSILINDGKGRFTLTHLHSLSQISPAFSLKLTDIDRDGNLDLYMLQNFYTPQIETGRMDSGVSLMLRGDGKANFTPVWPQHSGLIVPEDAKSLAMTDINMDGHPDFIIISNNAPATSFLHAGTSTPPHKLILKGIPGNPSAIGARVTVHYQNGKKQTHEIYAGEGYLSQSTPTLYLTNTTTNPIKSLDIRWPNGTLQNTKINSNDKQTIVTHP